MAIGSQKLEGLKVGDFIFAKCRNGAKLYCLVTGVMEGVVFTRRITSQGEVKFALDTGIELHEDSEKRCEVQSIAPLSPDIYRVLLEFDRRYSVKKTIEEPRLTEIEKAAFDSADVHFENNPL